MYFKTYNILIINNKNEFLPHFAFVGNFYAPNLFLNLKVLNLNLNRCLVCNEFKVGLWITAFEFKF